MTFIKNINHEEVLKLASEIDAFPGQIASKTLAQNANVSITLFAISEGEEISAHKSTGDAFVFVLEGSVEITIDGATHLCKKDECIVMPANKAHAVLAKELLKMLLVVVFPSKNK